MKRIRKSFFHAWEGLMHAFEHEKNVRLFVPVYVCVLLAGAFVRLLTWEWLTLIIAGFTFLSFELMNTALERLTDVLDDQKKVIGRTHYHASLKATKDVAAGASLVCFIALITTIITVFRPYAEMYFGWNV